MRSPRVIDVPYFFAPFPPRPAPLFAKSAKLAESSAACVGGSFNCKKRLPLTSFVMGDDSVAPTLPECFLLRAVQGECAKYIYTYKKRCLKPCENSARNLNWTLTRFGGNGRLYSVCVFVLMSVKCGSDSDFLHGKIYVVDGCESKLRNVWNI